MARRLLLVFLCLSAYELAYSQSDDGNPADILPLPEPSVPVALAEREKAVIALSEADIPEFPDDFIDSLDVLTDVAKKEGHQAPSRNKRKNEIGMVRDLLFRTFRQILHFQPLDCEDLMCSSCIGVLGKGGCFVFGYNSTVHENATLSAQIQVGGTRIWGVSMNAGKAIPNCVRLFRPIKEVCLQDLHLDIADQGIPEAHVCLTINFKSYSLGLRACALFVFGSFSPLLIPSIVRT